MSKHTPAPWEGAYFPSAGFQLKARMRSYENRLRTFFEAPPHPNLIVEFGRDGLQLYATLGYETWTQWETPEQKEEQEANFKLIAASPDLLAALKGLKRGDCWCEAAIGNPMMAQIKSGHTPECEAARAAVEKAEGKDEITK